jgi:hypothetical protein
VDKVARLLAVGMWVWLVALGAVSCGDDDAGGEAVTAAAQVVPTSTARPATTSTATTTTTLAPRPLAPLVPTTGAAAVAQQFVHAALSRGDVTSLVADFHVVEDGTQLPRDAAEVDEVVARAHALGRSSHGGGEVVPGPLNADDFGDEEALGPGCGWVGDFHVECHVVHRTADAPDVVIDVFLLCDAEPPNEYRVVDVEVVDPT